MIVLRCTNDNGQVVDLDVIEANQPLRLDISAIENTQIGSSFGISSQTFSLPGTDKNNAFFGNLFNLGADAAVALVNSVPCQLLTDGQSVFNGKLYIDNIITDQKGYTTYQVNLVNETVDFKFQLNETLLAELDWSAYNHAYTYANITASWADGLFSGDIVYPHVNYGIPDGNTDLGDYAFATANTSRTIDNYDYALRVDQFKPSIKVKAVLDTIFDSIDYKYTSSFIESAQFDDLYMLATSYDGLGAYNENPSTGSAWVYRDSGFQTFNALTDTTVNYQAEVFDNFNRFDIGTDEYTTYADGYYNFALGFNYAVTTNYSLNNNPRFFISLYRNGNVEASKTYVQVPVNGILYVPFANILLDQGDTISVHIEYQSSVGNEIITLFPGTTSTYFKVEGPASYGGGNIDMGLQFPNDLKVLDFIQGLIEKFNLVIEPVAGEQNLLRIDPFQTWVDTGVVKDWTDKVDRSVKFTIKHPILEQPKTIVFRDEDDEAVHNKYTVDNFGDVFGTYTYSNTSDLPEGERTVGKTFAATPVKGIINGDSMIIPHLGRIDTNKQTAKPFQFKPRLLYANGLVNVPTTALGISGSTQDPGNYWMQDETGVRHKLSQFFQMSTFTSIPVDFNSSQDLHYSNLNWWQYFQNTGINGRTPNDAYSTYWATYINSLYDIDARKLTCNVYIEPSEIQNISLNDKIFIDGQYYRINKISGANVTYKDTIEVEFIKELNRQLKYPRRRVFDITIDAPRDIYAKSVNEDGSVDYVTFDGDLPVEDYQVLKQAAFKDQFTIFESSPSTGSVGWNIPAPVVIAPERAVFGANNVDDNVGVLLVAGGNNTIGGQSSNLLMIGEDNTIEAGNTTVTVSGRGNTVGVSQENITILGSIESSATSSNANLMILGSTGSYAQNTDDSAIINGYNASLVDSDVTTLITPHENEVVINGSGHTVIGLNLEGGGLDLLDYRNNSNWLGDTYLGEAIFQEAKTLTLGDGTSIDLSDTQYKHDSLYILNWTGLAPGTASIDLPNAINNDYKKIIYTFKANGTFDGTTYLEINGFSGIQTIEGSTTYAFSSSFDYLQITPNGTDWLILNAPGGGTGAPGPSGSNTIAVYDESNPVGVFTTLNFSGSFISASNQGAGIAKIEVTTPPTASYALQAGTAGFAVSASQAVSASFADQAGTSGFATSASFANTASFALTSSYVAVNLQQVTDNGNTTDNFISSSAGFILNSTSSIYSTSPFQLTDLQNEPTIYFVSERNNEWQLRLASSTSVNAIILDKSGSQNVRLQFSDDAGEIRGGGNVFYNAQSQKHNFLQSVNIGTSGSNTVTGTDSLTVGISHQNESNNTIVSGDSNVINQYAANSAIIGGTFQQINGELVFEAQNSAIIAGAFNNMSPNVNSVMLGGNTNTMESFGGDSNVIVGGSVNKISGSANYAAVIGGTNNKSSHINSVVIGGQNLSTTADNQVVVPDLRIASSATLFGVGGGAFYTTGSQEYGLGKTILILESDPGSSGIYTEGGNIYNLEITDTKDAFKVPVDITGSLNTTGSVSHKGLANTTTSNIIYYDTASGELTYGANAGGATFPYTGSAIITGSLILTGSATFGAGVGNRMINIQNIGGTANTLSTDGTSTFGIAIGTANTTGKGITIAIGNSNSIPNLSNGDTNGAIGWNNSIGGNFTGRNFIVGSNLSISGNGNYRGMFGGQTNASTAGSWNGVFAGSNNTVSHSRSVVIGGQYITSSADSTVYVPNLNISGSLTVAANEVLTLTPVSTLPASAPTGSFAVSGSTPPKPYFYDGTTWNALY